MSPAQKISLLIAAAPLLWALWWWQMRPLVINGSVPGTITILFRILIQFALIGLTMSSLALLPASRQSSVHARESLCYLLLMWGPVAAIVMYRYRQNPAAYVWYKQ